MSKVAVVLGVGPGIGRSVAKKFASSGYRVALLARKQDNLITIQKEIEDSGHYSMSFTVDASSEESVKKTFTEIRSKLGPPEVLVYNAAVRRLKKLGITEVTTEEFSNIWKINCLGGFFASREVVPDMLKKGQGTIIFTGATASIRALDGLSSFAVSKFGLRALAQSMARELGQKGIHVAHVIIDGAVDNSLVRKILDQRNQVLENWMNPDGIAEQYWNIHTQDKSTWTHEMDLRPAAETIVAKM